MQESFKRDVRSALDLGVQPLQRVRGVDLRPVRAGEGHEGEHIVLDLFHLRAELGELGAQLIGH